MNRRIVAQFHRRGSSADVDILEKTNKQEQVIEEDPKNTEENRPMNEECGGLGHEESSRWQNLKGLRRASHSMNKMIVAQFHKRGSSAGVDILDKQEQILEEDPKKNKPKDPKEEWGGLGNFNRCSVRRMSKKRTRKNSKSNLLAEENPSTEDYTVDGACGREEQDGYLVPNTAYTRESFGYKFE